MRRESPGAAALPVREPPPIRARALGGRAARGRALGPLLACALLLGEAEAFPAVQSGGGRLVGTVVLEEGGSYAVFSHGSNSWRVEEGGELFDGARLLQVQCDRIVLEGETRREELHLFVTYGGGFGRPGAAPSPARAASATPAAESVTSGAPAGTLSQASDDSAAKSPPASALNPVRGGSPNGDDLRTTRAKAFNARRSRSSGRHGSEDG